MNDALEYKGYVGTVYFSNVDEVFHGKLEGIRDLITYEGTDVASMKKNFHEAVDDYRATCAAHGKVADIPYKGTFNVRVGRERHKRAALFAAQNKKRLNAVVNDALDRYLESEFSKRNSVSR
jgi:predicted HicB family RNase H-like nuclease